MLVEGIRLPTKFLLVFGEAEAVKEGQETMIASGKAASRKPRPVNAMSLLDLAPPSLVSLADNIFSRSGRGIKRRIVRDSAEDRLAL